MFAAVVITRLIAPISLPCSPCSAAGSTVGVTDYDFFITGVIERCRLADLTSSCRSGVLLILSLTIFVMWPRGCQSPRAVSGKAYQHLLRVWNPSQALQLCDEDDPSLKVCWRFCALRPHPLFYYSVGSSSHRVSPPAAKAALFDRIFVGCISWAFF